MKKIVVKKLVTNRGVFTDQAILFDEKIRQIVPMNSSETDRIATVAEAYYAVPGFIDIHIHGSAGADTMDGTPEAIDTICRALTNNGCTAFLPTTMTQSPENIVKALDNVRRHQRSQVSEVKGADIVGVHLEGPFISPNRVGAQNPEYVLKPTPDSTAFLKPYYDLIKLITVAPEEDEDFTMIKQWSEAGIVCSMGHTVADYDLLKRAVSAGISHATHCFNAMTGLHHRKPGGVGAALTLPISCEMIVDGFHLHPAIVQLICRAKEQDKRILITDAMRAAGLGDCESELGGQKVFVKDGQATLADGTLAGSVLKLDKALRNTMEFTGLSLEEIIPMLTLNPAKLLKIDDRKGDIAVGLDADIVLLSEDFDVEQTFVRGCQ